MIADEPKPSSPDSSGEKNDGPIIRMDATLTRDQVKLLPELHLLTYAKVVEAIAIDVEVYTKIPRLVPIAQSAHESRNGNSGLARGFCNLFGITATDRWKKSGNEVANMPTFEYVNGHKVDTFREFRAYKSWRDSFFDWGRLLTELSPYKAALSLLRDPASVPAGIAEMGKVYATDPNYAIQVVSIYKQLIQGGKQ